MKGEETRLNRWVSFSIYVYIRMWWNGRHVGFRFRCLKAYGFKSCHPDQLKYAAQTVSIMEGDELICLINSKNMCMNCC